MDSQSQLLDSLNINILSPIVPKANLPLRKGKYNICNDYIYFETAVFLLLYLLHPFQLNSIVKRRLN